MVLHVKCKDCKEEDKIKPYHSHRMGRRGAKTVTLNSRAALAMIVTGSHSHLKADLSILGVGKMTGATFKAREREVGAAIESVCQESCAHYRAKVKVESDMVDSNRNALISVVYNGAWQKHGKAQDSITGFGKVIGESIGKVHDCGIRSTRCCKCENAGESNAESHNCRKDHSGSSKSVECGIAVARFNNVTNHGFKYSSYTGDEDGTTESYVKCQVDYKTTKKIDKNHATKLRLSLLVILNFLSLKSFNIVFYRPFKRIVPVVYQILEPPEDSAKYWQCKQDLDELSTTACIPWVIQLATNQSNDYFHELCTD